MPKTSIYVLILLIVLVVIAGGFYWSATRPFSEPPKTATLERIPADALRHFKLFLHREPCADDCPVYAVLARGSGEVEYAGGKNVEVTGDKTAALSVDQLTRLYRAVTKAKFFSIEDIYHNGPGGVGCTSLTSGKPRVVIGVTKKSKTKVIHYDYGCEGAPESLEHLAGTVDRVLNTQRWIE